MCNSLLLTEEEHRNRYELTTRITNLHCKNLDQMIQLQNWLWCRRYKETQHVAMLANVSESSF